MSSNIQIHKEFVDVRTKIKPLLVCLQYATTCNFLGRPLAGYKCQRPLLTHRATDALYAAQKKFEQDGFQIVLYDAYRPLKAVKDLVAWGKSSETRPDLKALYYPLYRKPDLFQKGYISEHSSHAGGSTVDITLIKTENVKNFSPQGTLKKIQLADGRALTTLDDGTLDMGGHFDLFDPSAHQNTTCISHNAQQNRAYLKNVMTACGFEVIATEWWHFTLTDEPFRNKSFDFDIV